MTREERCNKASARPEGAKFD